MLTLSRHRYAKHIEFLFINAKTLACVVQWKWISSFVARIYATLLCSSPRLGSIDLVLLRHQGTVSKLGMDEF